ncbi:hypothetical protein ACVBEH_33940, partial [Roseateles sp. GG27B]
MIKPPKLKRAMSRPLLYAETRAMWIVWLGPTVPTSHKSALCIITVKLNITVKIGFLWGQS